MDTQPTHRDRGRRSRRTVVATLAVTVAGAAIGLLSLAPSRPALVFNYSPSIPLGIYAVSGPAWRPADAVAVMPGGHVADLLNAFGVLPRGRLLLKRVAAAGGDTVCRSAESVLVNRRPVATASTETSDGRALPVWTGCVVLASDQVFLLGDHPSSFDGRYFGPTPSSSIIGVLRPIWLFGVSAREAA